MSKKLDNYHKVLKILDNQDIYNFIVGNFKHSLRAVGFSKILIEDLLSNLLSLDDDFFARHGKELHRVETVGFFQDIVPDYFSKHVVPSIPRVKKVLDIGCGTGILAYVLSRDSRFGSVVGIDLKSYPEWKKFKGSKVRFHVVGEKEFARFVRKENPDAIVLTWTLHHMEHAEQERYLKSLHRILDHGTKIVILEDSHSTTLPPVNGTQLAKEFFKWSEKARKDIMFVYCWVANRVLAQRDKVPTPAGFRALEEWKGLFRRLGFGIEKESFIGFPDRRDINTPQSLIVIKVIK
jgi:ubiquinone/menaquinone biosynthesis C-methylase UbiE